MILLSFLRVRKIRYHCKSRKPKEYIFANNVNELNVDLLSESCDEIWFFSIKEEIPGKKLDR